MTSSFFTSRDFTPGTTEHPSSAGSKPSEPDERKENKMGFFSRPSMGDRMDNAQEKRFRMQQKAEELAMEQAQMKLYEQQVRKAKAEAERRKNYRGSNHKAEDVRRGFFGW